MSFQKPSGDFYAIVAFLLVVVVILLLTNGWGLGLW